MEILQDNLININVNVCDRPYRLKVKPEEEESVRKAARLVTDKVKEFQNQYAAKDKQDYLAMCALMYATESLNNEKKVVINDRQAQEKLGELESRIDQALRI